MTFQFLDLQFRSPTDAEKQTMFLQYMYGHNAMTALLHGAAVLTGQQFDDLWAMPYDNILQANEAIINLWGGNPKRWHMWRRAWVDDRSPHIIGL